MTKKDETYKCLICGNTVKVIQSGVGKLVCCNQDMELLETEKFDIAKYSKKELIEMAIKSEIESEKIYRFVEEQTDNMFLKLKMRFLADEEKKHKILFENIFLKLFPNESINIPEETMVPLPNIDSNNLTQSFIEIFEQAKISEKQAHDFYIYLTEVFSQDKRIVETLKFFASMELIHYKIIDNEINLLRKNEDYLEEWPMTHIGP